MISNSSYSELLASVHRTRTDTGAEQHEEDPTGFYSRRVNDCRRYHRYFDRDGDTRVSGLLDTSTGFRRTGLIRPGQYVESITVNGAVVSIQYGNKANIEISGWSVILTGTGNESRMIWTCTSDGIIPDSYLPSSC